MLVIGSGAAGAAVTKRLTDLGAKVVCLEVPKPASKPAVPLAGAQDTRSLLPSAPDFWITRSCFRPSDERVSCRNERWRLKGLKSHGRCAADLAAHDGRTGGEKADA